MSYRRFAIYNVAGGIGWVLSMTMAGYYLGRIPLIRDNFEITVLAIVVISVLPIVFSWIKHMLSGDPLQEVIEREAASGSPDEPARRS